MPPALPELSMVGLDFRSADVATREQLAFAGDAAVRLLREAKSVPGVREVALVCTCNRTELYAEGEGGGVPLAEWLAVRHPLPESRALTMRRDDEAARHLMRVACGLESAILGDAFVLGQLKGALPLSSEAGALGPVLTRLFTEAIRAARAARAATGIARGAAGLGAAVASLVDARRGRDAAVLLLGAGTTASDIARQLAKRRVGDVVVASRTDARAESLARAAALRSARWTDLPRLVAEADVIVAATSTPAPIVGPSLLASARSGLLVIDVGVPRNVEAGASAVEYLTLDDVSHRRDEAMCRRRAAVPAVEAIVERHLRRWQRWAQALPLEGLLKQVFADEARLRSSLAAEVVARGWLPTLEAADRFVAGFTRGVLRRHAAELRAWAA
jgi:glutamyl-tRNA reductase